METTLIVDGYNVLNAWPDLEDIKNESLEHARDKLTAIISGYGAFSGYNTIIVYDAHLVNCATAVEEQIGTTTVVYTGEGQTADSYIERLAYTMAKQKHRVFVATSDGDEQMAILGVGAYRISVRELYRDIKESNKKQLSRYAVNHDVYQRNEIVGRIDDDVFKKLDLLRRGR